MVTYHRILQSGAGDRGLVSVYIFDEIQDEILVAAAVSALCAYHRKRRRMQGITAAPGM